MMLSRSLGLFALVGLLACGSDDGAKAGAGVPDGGAGASSSGSSGSTSSGGLPNPDGGPPIFPQGNGDPCRGTPLPDDALTVPGLCTRLVASNGVGLLRQIAFAPNGDLIGTLAGGQIIIMRDENNDGTYQKTEIHPFATAPGGNGSNAHLDVASGYVYSGTDTGVVRFKYDPNSFTGGAAETVIINQPTGGHGKHTTHVYDGFLYVHSGSAGNMTPADSGPADQYDAGRSLIRKFDLSKFNPATPWDWKKDGENVSLGLRNALGFKRNETSKKIYAIVNGLDGVTYKGVDVHDNNPGEQIVEIASGKNYGFPFCYTAQLVPTDATHALIPGTQVTNDQYPQGHDDAWCAANSTPPVAFIQAHSAPLDIVFFDQQPAGGLPEKYRNGAFVALHGSWDRTPSTGYKVIFQPFNADGSSPLPTAEVTGDAAHPWVSKFPYEVVFGSKTQGFLEQESWSWRNPTGTDSPRPSGVAISPIDGALYIATDSPGALYRVGAPKQ
jgi:glucose/arabinose dehydrogenase